MVARHSAVAERMATGPMVDRLVSFSGNTPVRRAIRISGVLRTRGVHAVFIGAAALRRVAVARPGLRRGIDVGQRHFCVSHPGRVPDNALPVPCRRGRRQTHPDSSTLARKSRRFARAALVRSSHLGLLHVPFTCRNPYGKTALAPNAACRRCAPHPKRSGESSRLIFAVCDLIRGHQSRHGNGNVQDAGGSLQRGQHSRRRPNGNNVPVT